MSAERESSVDPIVYEVRESRGRGEEMEIGQERERHAAARTPPAPRLLLLLSNDGRSAPRASALAGSSFPSSSLLEINHVMCAHGVCQVESSMARVFELVFVSIV